MYDGGKEVFVLNALINTLNQQQHGTVFALHLFIFNMIFNVIEF